MASKNRIILYFIKRALSFKFAFNGLVTAIKSQANLRIHLVAAIIATTMGFYFHISYAEWILIILAIGFVISAELFNSAIENLVDMVSPQRNLLAGKVKDMAAGAVLMSAISAAIIGLVIFLPKIRELL